MSLAVFDIDGVVADVSHRLHHLDQRPKDWSAFFRAAADDPPLATGVALVHELAASHDIVWLTGRPAWVGSLTRSWLDDQGLPSAELHMRPNADHRPARLFKLTMLRKFAPRTVARFIDDDPEVTAAATAAGFPATLADWLSRGEVMRDAQDRSGRT